MVREINAQYNVARPGSLPIRLAANMRRVLYDKFLSDASVVSSDTLLDVGVTSDTSYESSNYLEKWYPHKEQITAAGIDDARFLEELYPGVRFVKADGRALPFPDQSFDVVHSSAVLEHVGSREEQKRLILECFRVARRIAFFTTPNRWFPVEFHTVLPIVHWMPPRVFRAIIRRLGHRELSLEQNLNLLGPRDLRLMCEEVGLMKFDVTTTKLFGWSSNLVLIVKR